MDYSCFIVIQNSLKLSRTSALCHFILSLLNGMCKVMFSARPKHPAQYCIWLCSKNGWSTTNMVLSTISVTRSDVLTFWALSFSFSYTNTTSPDVLQLPSELQWLLFLLLFPALLLEPFGDAFWGRGTAWTRGIVIVFTFSMMLQCWRSNISKTRSELGFCSFMRWVSWSVTWPLSISWSLMFLTSTMQTHFGVVNDSFSSMWGSTWMFIKFMRSTMQILIPILWITGVTVIRLRPSCHPTSIFLTLLLWKHTCSTHNLQSLLSVQAQAGASSLPLSIQLSFYPRVCGGSHYGVCSYQSCPGRLQAGS